MKKWKVRMVAASLTAVAMLFAVSGFTATAQVVTQDIDAYVCEDLDGDGLIDTCSTCFDTDGDGLVDTCYESSDVFGRIGEPIGSNVDPLGFDDPVNFADDPTGLDGPVDFDDPTGFDDGSAHPEEGPIASDAGKDGEEPLASDAGKGEE
jgi:hypothetical protein